MIANNINLNQRVTITDLRLCSSYLTYSLAYLAITLFHRFLFYVNIPFVNLRYSLEGCHPNKTVSDQLSFNLEVRIFVS